MKRSLGGTSLGSWLFRGRRTSINQRLLAFGRDRPLCRTSAKTGFLGLGRSVDKGLLAVGHERALRGSSPGLKTGFLRAWGGSVHERLLAVGHERALRGSSPGLKTGFFRAWGGSVHERLLADERLDRFRGSSESATVDLSQRLLAVAGRGRCGGCVGSRLLRGGRGGSHGSSLRRGRDGGGSVGDGRSSTTLGYRGRRIRIA